MADPEPLEAVADNLGGQPLEVDADVGQLGHRASVPSGRERALAPAMLAQREPLAIGSRRLRGYAVVRRTSPATLIARSNAADGACQPTIAPCAAIIASACALNSGK